ncbi:hypothetical protein BHM03_00021409 [Ensete ventricosum]|nr:hypothetical protein BHM03_00021409 [Ensete ventricosum]
MLKCSTNSYSDLHLASIQVSLVHSVAVVGFIMIPVLDGTIAVEMVFITRLKMEDTFHCHAMRNARKLMLLKMQDVIPLGLLKIRHFFLLSAGVEEDPTADGMVCPPSEWYALSIVTTYDVLITKLFALSWALYLIDVNCLMKFVAFTLLFPGKVYRLRSPNRRYLASISTFDSSNPTKDWGFPDLYANFQSIVFHTSDRNYQSCLANEVIGEASSCMIDEVPNTLEKVLVFYVHFIVLQHQNFTYKDRAAARRMLHGDFSIGPGQKDTENSTFDEASSPSQYSSAEDAAAEAINMSFGSRSYARRILENMGWNEVSSNFRCFFFCLNITQGEGLGNSRKGILEPLRAVGNKGCAGLGWSGSLRHA